ncbi:MAG: hypothetical protein JEZ07_00415 [Phycisphaerae bacterium]|nr:hypothetical protein [Phycisphaerae bacterium]
MRILLIYVLLNLMVCVLAADIFVPGNVSVELYVDDIPNCQDLAFDSNGRLFVANDSNTSNQQIYIVPAGGGSWQYFGPVLTDTDAIAIDPRDNVYIGDENGRVYKVTPEGVSSLFASSFLGNVVDIMSVSTLGSPQQFITGSVLYVPFDMTFANNNKMYVVEAGATTKGLYTVDAAGSVSLFVEFPGPVSCIFDPATNKIYVGDVADQCIYIVSLDGNVEVFATGIEPRGMTIGSDGCLYVSDRLNSSHGILKFEGKGQLPSADFDENGLVNLFDFHIFSNSWLALDSDFNWNPECDISEPSDNIISFDDFVVFASQWLECTHAFSFN